MTKGKFVLVDEELYEVLTAMGPWLYQVDRNGGYAAKRPLLNGVRLPIVWLHRVVLSPPEELQVDHVNRNTLDCRRLNLRAASRAGNNRNRGKHSGSVRALSSSFKGVCRPKDYRKFIAMITVNNKTLRIGTFEKEEDAARAYDAAARILFGEFACTNFPAAE